MRTKTILVFVMMLLFVFTAGCGSIGKTAGKAGAKIEKGYEEMKDGYQKGYSEESGK